MTGQAMGGFFAALANLVTMAMGSRVEDSGLGFFVFATLMAICTLVGYCSLYCIVSIRKLFVDYYHYTKVLVDIS